MDRCDFCSIMTCLKNHISESNQMSQPEFLCEIFADFMDSQEIGDFSLDNGLVCRWMTGQAKISPKISSYYAKPSKQELLAATMDQNLMPLMADSRQAIQDVYTLFIQDDTILRSEKDRTGISVQNSRFTASVSCKTNLFWYGTAICQEGCPEPETDRRRRPLSGSPELYYGQ